MVEPSYIICYSLGNRNRSPSAKNEKMEEPKKTKSKQNRIKKKQY
jgi:hypothetical protein